VINLLFTDFCNRDCPYCFAREKLRQAGQVRNHLSFEDLVTVLDFLESSGEKRMKILGGEPTLHPRFAYFLRYVMGRQFGVDIFTNGIVDHQVLQDLKGLISDFEPNAQELRFVVNLNEPKIRGPQEYERQKNFFKALNKNVSLSFNIFRIDHDFSFLTETITQYDLFPEIRVGLAQPIVGFSNKGLRVVDYPALPGPLMELAATCDQAGVSFNLDCGFAMCMFSDEQLGALYRAGANLGFACGPCVDIGTDLKVWFCFPLSAMPGLDLSDFSNEGQLVKHLEGIFKSELERQGIYESCSDCKYLQRKQCAGGCIAHYLKRDIAQVT
jgi:radical SAM family protein